MLIVAIDTSGKSGGITLAEGDHYSFRVLESSPISGGMFSAQLVPTLASLLDRRGASPRDIDGFAAASGPGSFTGLRVGLAAIKGLAEVLHAPIATVSVLEALAISSGEQGKIAAALDAGRGEVFFGLYEVDGAEAHKLQEGLLSRDEFLGLLQRERTRCVVTSDSALVRILQPAEIQVKETPLPGSEAIARIGLPKLLKGEKVSVEELDANYLRRSDAEIFSSTPGRDRSGHRGTSSSGQPKRQTPAPSGSSLHEEPSE
jgi:tRNA threonylcarbamoyladenosine biosynthesis protein TsaB